MSAAEIRRVALTGGIACTTVFGAWYGAGLKTQQDIKKERQEVVEATPEEHVARLELAKAKLITRKREIERKISALGSRKENTDAKA
ncbi:hypothetical protein EJ08DRAFT_451998 [Tothia fuscella]|uniref:Uncharacterized protein n=1 Tax=Tothia fuscella TaxID=1048955 RepID=A0A9P4NIS8_9PEZI|nr:hypothetical protein EJ08DRAFT_451998 [Tothia fuscella]